MKLGTIKTTLLTSTFGLVALLGMSEAANAQSRNRGENFPPTVYNQRIEQERVQAEKQRQYEEQIRLEQKRQEELRNQNERRSNRWESNVKYKVFQNGKFFITDARGLQSLKQAVIRGYEEGFKAGINARKNRKKGGFYGLPTYSNVGYGYQNQVEKKMIQFYFQKGAEEGFADGMNAKRFRGWYQDDANISEREIRAILRYEKL